MSFNQRGWIPSLIALAGVIIMIAYAFSTTIGSNQRALDAAKAHWEANKPSDYQYIVQIGCFCPQEYSQPVQIVVYNGRFFAAEGSTATVSDTYIEQYGTVESIFGVLENAYKDGADEIIVEYDPKYGVPLRFTIDRMKNAIDDEMSLTITDFQILDTGE